MELQHALRHDHHQAIGTKLAHLHLLDQHVSDTLKLYPRSWEFDLKYRDLKPGQEDRAKQIRNSLIQQNSQIEVRRAKLNETLRAQLIAETMSTDPQFVESRA